LLDDGKFANQGNDNSWNGTMKLGIHTLYLSAAVLIASTSGTRAFALLGPVQPWMQASNGVLLPNDIGGPMPIGSGYRWNVPVVTYGFDQSFLNFFGTNGVAAVEGAIQIVNSLPPASQIMLPSYPFLTEHLNYAAQAQSLCDLQSQALSLLVEHMGLAEPTRSIYVLQQWNPILMDSQSDLLSVFEGGPLADYVTVRNYDPQTLIPSPYINGTLYSGEVVVRTGQNDIYPFAVSPLSQAYNAVADFGLTLEDTGAYYDGLTYDDVGGLAYLLSTNNINYERLLPGVVGVGANSNAYVNGAWRPGVDKITFIPQPVDSRSGAFLPTTNYFTDNFVTNGVVVPQQLSRIIAQPDFMFSAGDLTTGAPTFSFSARTGTTNWLNNSVENGNTNGAGPGVIQPPVRIVFNKLGRYFESGGDNGEDQVLESSQFWGSFDGSTNVPVAYPISQAGTNQLTVHLWLFGDIQASFVWTPSSVAGGQFAMQTSTDLLNWTTLFTLTNNGSVNGYFNGSPASASRFYRLMPQ
jgi:hypothetical protein